MLFRQHRQHLAVLLLQRGGAEGILESCSDLGQLPAPGTLFLEFLELSTRVAPPCRQLVQVRSRARPGLQVLSVELGADLIATGLWYIPYIHQMRAHTTYLHTWQLSKICSEICSCSSKPLHSSRPVAARFSRVGVWGSGVDGSGGGASSARAAKGALLVARRAMPYAISSDESFRPPRAAIGGGTGGGVLRGVVMRRRLLLGLAHLDSRASWLRAGWIRGRPAESRWTTAGGIPLLCRSASQRKCCWPSSWLACAEGAAPLVSRASEQMPRLICLMSGLWPESHGRATRRYHRRRSVCKLCMQVVHSRVQADGQIYPVLGRSYP